VCVRILLGAVLTTAVLMACSAPAKPLPPEPSPTEIPATLELPERPTGQAWRALSLVPADATVVTITDFDAIRARFGVPEMTSDDLMTDRSAFWERTRRDAVLLTDGLFTAEHSRFWLDHGFTGDDVDWEVRFTGPSGSGYVVAFRPGLDMGRVEGALGEKAMAGATVLAEEHLLVKGIADEGDAVWASDPLLPDLADDGAESAYLRRGCVPVQTALGDDATAEDQATLVGELDPRNLEELEAFSLSFADGLGTARLGAGRGDLVARGRITDAWPVVDTAMGYRDGFGPDALVDPSTGRIGLRLRTPHGAAAVTLADLLPFAICDEIEPFAEPTGL
jgi:hypothetical protein